MLETFSLGSNLMLLDYTGRLVRNGKARMDSTVKDVFSRLETNAEMWQSRPARRGPQINLPLKSTPFGLVPAEP